MIYELLRIKNNKLAMQLCAENILLDVHSIVSIDEKISLDLSSFVMDRGFITFVINCKSR